MFKSKIWDMKDNVKNCVYLCDMKYNLNTESGRHGICKICLTLRCATKSKIGEASWDVKSNIKTVKLDEI